MQIIEVTKWLVHPTTDHKILDMNPAAGRILLMTGASLHGAFHYHPSTNYTPDIQSMWGYIVFAFPFVRCTYVRSFVRSFVFLSQGQSFCVKVYKTSYFEDPLMDFIHFRHDGRYRSKVFISTIPTPRVTLGSWT